MKLLIITFYKLKMMLGDRLFFIMMIVIPLFITIATGYALRYEKLNTIPIAFVDEDKSEYSSVLLERMSQKDGLKVEMTGRETAVSMLEGSKVEQVFIIKKGFEEKIKNEENKELIDVVNSPSSYSADFTSEVAAGEVMRLIAGNMAVDWVTKQYKKLDKPVNGNFEKDIEKYYQSLWQPEPLMTIDYKEFQGNTLTDVERTVMPAATASSTGIITAFIMFYILFSSGWLVEERTNGTLKRLTAGPNALYLSYAGSVLALFISGTIQILVFSLTDKLVFDVDLFPGGLSYIVFLAYLLSVISISLFLSSVLKTQAQLQAGAPVLALLTGFAGGCFWNFVEMPERIRQLSMITPQGWALEGINRLLLNPMDFSAVLVPVLILFGIALILLPLSYIIISIQLKYG
jgi:ABC-2 type transport system permease protein